ncbi:TIGR02679 domain-containing protein [Paenibacillus xanthanilyticus]|uniref:TIGR02679 domain-containing protein n=1 Tax=Paenibacillus xanthanilyticus TaxID=1783531 RepID=A0ABV8JVA3_9BACL
MPEEQNKKERDEEAVRAYFARPGLERFMSELRRRYASSTVGARGYITLPRVNDEERQALDDFYGTYSQSNPKEPERYSIAKFEKLLLERRFKLTVAELLAVLNGGKVLTRKEQQLQSEEAWLSMIDRALIELGDGQPEKDGLMRWAEGLRDEASPGSRTLRRQFAISREEATECLRQCLAALKLLHRQADKKPMRLPVLAAEVVGDAHALDWKQVAGRVFWWGLTVAAGWNPHGMLPEEEESGSSDDAHPVQHSNAMIIREGYRRGGIIDDDLSSQVMLYSPALFGCNEERVLTLRQVERLAEEGLKGLPSAAIFMVENPSVFAELVDAHNERSATIACTCPQIVVCGSGQPTTAVLRLLDVWLNHGTETASRCYYAGDLDPAGLSIAQGLRKRYGEKLTMWRMDEILYRRFAGRGVPLTVAERERMRTVDYEWAPGLSLTMVDVGIKLHQELWLAELLDDHTVLCCAGSCPSPSSGEA